MGGPYACRMSESRTNPSSECLHCLSDFGLTRVRCRNDGRRSGRPRIGPLPHPARDRVRGAGSSGREPRRSGPAHRPVDEHGLEPGRAAGGRRGARRNRPCRCRRWRWRRAPGGVAGSGTAPRRRRRRAPRPCRHPGRRDRSERRGARRAQPPTRRGSRAGPLAGAGRQDHPGARGRTRTRRRRAHRRRCRGVGAGPSGQRPRRTADAARLGRGRCRRPVGRADRPTGPPRQRRDARRDGRVAPRAPDRGGPT